mmetsp:Transcript_29046/g.62009  ORF Transcript_29046/g.62009 Transcript_29046/m.62009 type:complete len:87 (-) Transcript_29046:1958-2218(-)
MVKSAGGGPKQGQFWPEKWRSQALGGYWPNRQAGPAENTSSQVSATDTECLANLLKEVDLRMNLAALTSPTLDGPLPWRMSLAISR